MDDYNFQVFLNNYPTMFSFDPMRNIFKIFPILSLISIFFIYLKYLIEKENSSFLEYSNLFLLYANLLLSCGFLIPVFFRNQYGAIAFFSFLLLIQFTIIVTFNKFTIQKDFDFMIALIIFQLLSIQLMLKLRQKLLIF